MKNNKKLVLKRIYWRIRIVLMALRTILKANLGDRVKWQGLTWILVQRVGQSRWVLARKGEVQENVWETEFRKVRSLSNYWTSFLSGYRFYMTFWFDTWINEGIKPWMKGGRIWRE